MKRITTYKDSEGLHTLWALSSEIGAKWMLENHAKNILESIEKTEAHRIIHKFGYQTRVYVPGLSERWERPKAMHELETGVFYWSEQRC